MKLDLIFPGNITLRVQGNDAVMIELIERLARVFGGASDDPAAQERINHLAQQLGQSTTELAADVDAAKE